MATDASDIKTSAGKPKRVSGDQGSVEVHSIEDQIAADKYQEAKKRTRSGKNPFAGLRFRQRPPGGTGV
jgi:hypothetical protein